MVMLPFRFQDASLDDFPDDVARPARELVERVRAVPRETPVRRYVAGSGWSETGELERDLRGTPGLVIVGNVGAGKTHMAAAIANALEDVPCKFISALEIVEREKATIHSDEQPLALHELEGVLIIDDLSGIRPTEFALDTLAKIIRVRYDEAIATVVTTHAGHDDLAELYGAAIASRLLEFGPVVKLDGADRRAAPPLREAPAIGGGAS